jgi:DNA-binding winged helix-turn-helix (wHTH) protein/pimeloyl-ACP methyl ester carboxylesterase
MRFVFGPYVLDTGRRELSRRGEAVHMEPQVFDLLLHLIEHRDRVVSKDDLLAAVWNGRIVSESTLSNRINAARQAIGDSGEKQEFIKTIARRGLRFVGDVREESGEASPFQAIAAATAPTHARPPHQDVMFVRTEDRFHLAVATSGSGVPVVKAGNWLSHVEHDWSSPVSAPLLQTLSDRFRLIRYDARGNGLSDRDVGEVSFDLYVRDLETVVDALGLERFALFGISQGAAVSVAYAARHPERVTRLALHGSYAQGWARRGSAEEIAKRGALATLVLHGWGQDNPAFRQVFTTLYMPDATSEQTLAFNDLQRISATPENAVALMRAMGNMEITELLPRVRAPAIVLNSRGDASVPFEQGLAVAHGIPNARFVALESRNHVVLPHEPAWVRFTQELCDFLAEDEKGS